MLTTSGSLSPVALTNRFSSTTRCGATASHVVQKYDSVSFSEHTGSTDSAFLNLVGRLAKDVRTATTTADIRELHQAVQSDTYVPNPDAIASRMLLFTEA